MNLPYELLGKPKRTPALSGSRCLFKNTSAAAGMLHEERKGNEGGTAEAKSFRPLLDGKAFLFLTAGKWSNNKEV
ncbi:hypothetical protein ABE29_00365 [Cytobacillus firmus]|nr:hypothetical protein [Cytobacillus firmus]MBG9541318.1 hypothetical protein [Cytobacillus firmus]MBG9546411.1 hypothetical protein [Cytobacillus firmus]MBG9552900.1 hypothetical protein [Cytobacillus firmus]MBG9555978.1 hypothetical protein [Cytobacillus firmus]MBG9573143.1 hypothetical protein [Cytobacillus firmus]